MQKINYPCKQVWRLLIPDGAVGADEDFFDFFNATSTAGTGARIVVSSVKAISAGDVATTPAVGVNLHLTRTSDVGTSGTAATLHGNPVTAATFATLVGTGQPLPAGITARLKPTGGATLSSWLGWTSVETHETRAGTYAEKWLLNPEHDEAIVIGAGTGLKVIQGAVASAGSVGFIVTFGLLEQ